MVSKRSTQSWRETIKPLTSNNITFIGATAFIEYYEPMNLWQEEDNREKNLFIGWEDSLSKYITCFHFHLFVFINCNYLGVCFWMAGDLSNVFYGILREIQFDYLLYFK